MANSNVARFKTFEWRVIWRKSQCCSAQKRCTTKVLLNSAISEVVMAFVEISFKLFFSYSVWSSFNNGCSASSCLKWWCLQSFLVCYCTQPFYLIDYEACSCAVGYFDWSCTLLCCRKQLGIPGGRRRNGENVINPEVLAEAGECRVSHSPT